VMRGESGVQWSHRTQLLPSLYDTRRCTPVSQEADAGVGGNGGNVGADEVVPELVARLRPHFSCGSLAAAHTLNALGPLPAALRMMWEAASEWHLLAEGHHNVFGFNLWSPDGLEEATVNIFGDENCRQDWLNHHPNSCAAAGWVCCMAFSEFDFLFVCLEACSDRFGEVVHVVNNCGEERSVCTMTELLAHLVAFVEEGATAEREEVYAEMRSGVEGWQTGPALGLSRPLRALRAGVLTAMHPE